jgi:hypothetical protein
MLNELLIQNKKQAMNRYYLHWHEHCEFQEKTLNKKNGEKIIFEIFAFEGITIDSTKYINKRLPITINS